jgi:mono/diheme cytochrome c family protein
MSKVAKIAGVIIVILVVLAAVGVYSVSVLADRKAQRVVKLSVVPVSFRSDEESLRRGEYLFQSRGCMECHGADGRGKAFIDNPNGLYVKSPNIAPDGVAKNYTEQDWVRTIRHGIKPSGRPLLIMPSEDYSRLTDEDLAAIVAYVRSLPATHGGPGQVRLPLIVKALYTFGVIKDAAEKIDHALPPPQPIAAAATSEYGAYVANACVGCHGPGFSGGKIPGGPPDWPAAANLTPGSESVMPRYDTPARFITMMHTGKRPDGSAVSPVMPFASFKVMDETDLAAVYAYLQTLPPRAPGNR